MPYPYLFDDDEKGVALENKINIVMMLKEEFNRWKSMLPDRSDDQAAEAVIYDNRTIKDDVAHLWMWQRISVARMEAVVNDTTPDLDWFPERFEPEAEDDLDEINEWIYQTNKERPWTEVYDTWQKGFSRFIELAEMAAEDDLREAGKYPWLDGHPLIAVLQGSYGHHEEHREWFHRSDV